MDKKYILSKLNNELNENDVFLDEKKLDIVVLDVSRVLDKKITKEINRMKKEKDIRIDSFLKNKLRNCLLGYPEKNEICKNIKRLEYTQDELCEAYKYIHKGFMRNEGTMVKSIVARYKTNYLGKENNIFEKYLNYFDEIEKDKYQMIALNIKGEDQVTAANIVSFILEKYKNLSNYHYLVILFKDDKKIIPWKTIAETAISLENIKHEKNFNVFNRQKEKRISELNQFLTENLQIDFDEKMENEVNDFYSSIDFGFQFADLYITADGKTKALIMQKIQLDENVVPCPSCFGLEARGNSYPRVLYKSFECQNDNCPSRSKIGRGKRYDLFGIKKQIMLERHSENDYINEDLYLKYRKDIVDSEINIVDIIGLYSWEDDNVLLVNFSDIDNDFKGRKVVSKDIKLKKYGHEYNIYENIKVLKLYKTISDKIITPSVENLNFDRVNNSIIVNGDSSKLLYDSSFLEGKINIGTAITSPPYFNAREYSQWKNMICYYVDMMINAKAVYEAIEKKGVYIYNIGDIVDQDNVYIVSNMSKRRQMLGFYSILIFELVGFNCESNIIWNKGEVQSKRNSTPNHFPGYVKPINVYEHAFVFRKGEELYARTKIVEIDPVFKINSKGENILGHTAPYPIELAELIIPYIKSENQYTLDPFLGSGTTIIAMEKNRHKAIGFEVNQKYYELAKERVKSKK